MMTMPHEGRAPDLPEARAARVPDRKESAS